MNTTEMARLRKIEENTRFDHLRMKALEKNAKCII